LLVATSIPTYASPSDPSEHPELRAKIQQLVVEEGIVDAIQVRKGLPDKDHDGKHLLAYMVQVRDAVDSARNPVQPLPNPTGGDPAPVPPSDPSQPTGSDPAPVVTQPQDPPDSGTAVTVNQVIGGQFMVSFLDLSDSGSSSGGEHGKPQFCHYEPTTGQWSLRFRFEPGNANVDPSTGLCPVIP
jgi:hypothetical protein